MCVCDSVHGVERMFMGRKDQSSKCSDDLVISPIHILSEDYYITFNHKSQWEVVFPSKLNNAHVSLITQLEKLIRTSPCAFMLKFTLPMAIASSIAFRPTAVRGSFFKPSQSTSSLLVATRFPKRSMRNSLPQCTPVLARSPFSGTAELWGNGKTGEEGAEERLFPAPGFPWRNI